MKIFNISAAPLAALALCLTILPGCVGAQQRGGYPIPKHHQPTISLEGDRAAQIRKGFMEVMNKHDFRLTGERDGMMVFDRPASLPMARTIPGLPNAPSPRTGVENWFRHQTDGRAYSYRVTLHLEEEINGLPLELPPLATLENEEAVEEVIVERVTAIAIPSLFSRDQEMIIGETDLSRAVYGLYLQAELDQIEAMIKRPGEQDAFLSSTVTPWDEQYGYPGEPPGRFPEGLTHRDNGPMEGAP